MPGEVDIETMQAEIFDRRDSTEREEETAPDQPDIARVIRETLAREAWRAARLAAE